jgi:drug/metabolite transporter (DMT)-like permease
MLFAFAISCGAVVLFQLGTAIIGGVKSSVISTLDPILCIIIGALFLNEEVSVRGIVGSALVVIASVLIAMSDMKKRS